MSQQLVLGVDIGGSGMKAALVDPSLGRLVTERERIETPKPATPDSMAAVFGELVERFDWRGPVGSTFPGVIKHGSTVATAANLDPSWVGVNAAELFCGERDDDVIMINDADAAGLAEMRYGAGRSVDGTVMMITVGTGLGTAVFTGGKLVPNTELGHIDIDGRDAEEFATSRVRKEQGLELAEWAVRFDRYLARVEDLLWPDVFIIGGGISRHFDEFGSLLQRRAVVVPAELRNHAGIVGAALLAAP